MSPDLTVRTAKTAAEAAELAAEVCARWTFIPGGQSADAALLRRTALEQDEQSVPPQNDPMSFYIISPDGALGMTSDGGRSVRWLLMPEGQSPEALPVLIDPRHPWPLPLFRAVRYCPKCGKRLRPGSRFCGACGYRVPEE